MPGMSTLSWGMSHGQGSSIVQEPIYMSHGQGSSIVQEPIYMYVSQFYFNFFSFRFVLFIILYMVTTYLNLQNLPNCSIISLLNFAKLTIMFGVEMDF